MIVKIRSGIMAVAIMIAMTLIGETTLAVSAYDNVVSLTSNLKLSNSINSCSEQSHELDWGATLNNPSFWSSAVGSSYSTVHSAYNTALSNGSGWAVTQITWNASTSVGNLNWNSGDKAIQITLTADNSNSVNFSTRYGLPFAYMHSPNSTPVYSVIIGLNSNCEMKVAVARSLAGDGQSYQFFDNEVYLLADGFENRTFESYFINSSINYPESEGYEGEYALTVPSSQSSDMDGDGLTVAQEASQGTSDGNADGDGDGLSDMAESLYNSEREDVFCGVECAYPSLIKKDIYVEVDWMNDGFNEYKPSATQVNMLLSMFDSKDLTLHLDTGQYGGGGELSLFTGALTRTPTTGVIDYFDYKNGGDGLTASFSPNRHSIWRYMIYGYSYAENPSSSGWASVMGDSIFVSGGLIDNMAGLGSLDRAIAGSMAHEIGHSICLSDAVIYEEQPSECVYAGIDNNDEESEFYDVPTYHSVMNYRYQLTKLYDLGYIDYSDGSLEDEDHDDWNAVMMGMDGFSGTHTASGASLPSGYSTMPDGTVVVEEPAIGKAMTNRGIEDVSMDKLVGNTKTDPLNTKQAVNNTYLSEERGVDVIRSDGGDMLTGYASAAIISTIISVSVLVYVRDKM